MMMRSKWSAYVLMILLAFLLKIVWADEKTAELPDFDSMWDYYQPARTESVFREIIPAAKETDHPSYYGELLTQIGRTLGLQRRFDDGHAILDTVASMLDTTPAVVRIRYLLERGRLYNSSGRADTSKVFFLEAWGEAMEAGEDGYCVDALHMLGIVTPPTEQLRWNLKAMAYAEQSENEKARRWLGPLYNNIGWSYHDLAEYEKALELFEKSLQWRIEQNDDVGTRIAKWTIGRAYRSLGRIDEAIAMQQALLDEINEKNLDPDGYVHEELGECLLLKDRKDEAEPQFKKGYELLSRDPWMVENESERLERMRLLGEGKLIED